jgi:hypothetical protein
MAGRDPNNQSVSEGGGEGRLQDDKYVGIREAVVRTCDYDCHLCPLVLSAFVIVLLLNNLISVHQQL